MADMSSFYKDKNCYKIQALPRLDAKANLSLSLNTLINTPGFCHLLNHHNILFNEKRLHKLKLRNKFGSKMIHVTLE